MLFRTQSRLITEKIKAAKLVYNKSRIETCKDKHLFKLVDALLGKSSASPLPEHTNPAQLAREFSNFFCSKIKKIREALDEACSGPRATLSSDIFIYLFIYLITTPACINAH
jgi:hypothetical protein